MGFLVTPYQEEQGAPGLRPEEQGPQGLRQDPLGLGSNLGGIPLGKEGGHPAPKHGTGVLIKIPCSILIGWGLPNIT